MCVGLVEQKLWTKGAVPVAKIVRGSTLVSSARPVVTELKVHEQIARMVYFTGAPFLAVQNREFNKLMNMAFPGV